MRFRAAPWTWPLLTAAALSEHRTRKGFRGEPAVSYLLRTDQGTLREPPKGATERRFECRSSSSSP